MQYTEEHYAQMYNDLPEGLKDLVLSGRLAILVSAIGSRHGLNADQIADLEPAIEDVCLGLITKEELVDNILKTVNIDTRVANRIAAETELEILRPFEGELIIARKQKEDLDNQIHKNSGIKKTPNGNPSTAPTPAVVATPTIEPKNVSDHAENKKVSDWYNKNEVPKTENGKVSFDWDKDFAKKNAPEITETPIPPPTSTINREGTDQSVTPNLETKLDVLTESINKLVNTRFGAPQISEELSPQMKELTKRLEKAEKENEENKKLIKNLHDSRPTNQSEGDKIQIDKQRKVEISKPTLVISSSVSKDTLESIVQTRNQTSPSISNIYSSTSSDLSNGVSSKKVLSLEELVKKGDEKIKEAKKEPVKTGTLVFPGLNDEKKIDIKNISQKDSLRQTLLEDLEFLKNAPAPKTDKETENPASYVNNTNAATESIVQAEEKLVAEQEATDSAGTITPNTSNSTTLNQFKDELLPKTKEERMRVLQDKIKSLNKSVSVGGKTNITASGLDPYRL